MNNNSENNNGSENIKELPQNNNSNIIVKEDKPNKFLSIVWKILLVFIVFIMLFLGLIQFGVISLNSKIVPDAVILNQTEIGIRKGKSYQLITEVLPVNAENKQLIYESSNTAVAIVNELTGYVTAIADGTAIITAKTLINDKVSECVVNVGNTSISATSVSFKNKSVKIAAGHSELLTYVVSPSNATEQTMTFVSSDPSVATVDSKGMVTGIKEGNATITISANNGAISDKADVTVYKVGTSTVVLGEVVKTNNYPNSISVDESKNLAVGVEVQLEPKIYPADAVDDITWISSNPSVASVNEYGKVTANSVGEATIIAKTVNDKTATTNVKVGNYVGNYSIKLNEIYITTNYTLLRIGQNKRLYVSYLPVTATSPTVTWSTDNSTVATVDSDGLVKALSTGKTKIHAKAVENEKLFDSCTVEVAGNNNIVPITSISLESSSIEVGVKNTVSITPKINPSNATYKQVAYTSSNPSIATVDENGKVYGVSVGTATITITANRDVKATVNVNVKNIPSKSVELNSTSETIDINEIFTLVATVKPTTASDKTVTYTSSNPSVATVDKTGKVTAVSKGTTTITVKPNGGGSSSYCTITVK
ncbi:MAG: Ig domain-containing protein [Bacilli bacterium]|nr:Ig domain-containing protein [Bacilli bacterium]